MEGISKKRLEEIAEDYPPDHRNHRMAKYLIATECRELQESWMTLDEFLKSGFVGFCWIEGKDAHITTADYDGQQFWPHKGSVIPYPREVLNLINKVMPTHKPEPPK